MIIGLSGRKQSGKDTLANYLEEKKIATKFAFADTLKEMVSDIFGIPMGVLRGSDKAKNGNSPLKWGDISEIIRAKRQPREKQKSDFLTIRELLQVFGTDCCREFYSNFWVNLTMNKIKLYNKEESMWQMENTQHTIISDVRFPNEADAIRSNNGIVVRLTRNSDSVDTHSSETALDFYPNFDLLHDNRNLTKDTSCRKFLESLKDGGHV